ncbi:putative pregnancy-specific beta-1-glycoprotein 7 [Dromiciops gliroides]|uniref:putative pregnancy-specific beta-1-glycoprotein 7 n=1 Tax=Dromiciops gliroides TaxID=33562 RepID=UPI001CC39D0E|nr:putative pregnancy-specific beta-1-glycoprotein 7 [Dromiciops gliroides]
MERTSEPPHSGASPWKGLLITASILSCWIQPMSAQGAPVTVVPSPPHGTVGSSSILDIWGFSEQALSYNWYRKTTENSNRIAAYSVLTGVQTPADIREKVFSNGSLLIPNLTLSDTDVYIVLIVDFSIDMIVSAQAQLAVYGTRRVQNRTHPHLMYTKEPLYYLLMVPGESMTSKSCYKPDMKQGSSTEKPAKPNLSASSMNVIENGTLVFTCNTKYGGMNILWFFNNQPLSLIKRMSTSEDNQTLTIKSVKREDAGSYQCEVWNPIGANRSDPLNLTVTSSILSCWIQPMSAQGAAVTVVPSPPYGRVGSSSILDIRGFSEQVLGYSWYRKSVDNSNLIAAYSVSTGVQTPADIREKIFSNGSLLIPDLTLNDSDVYYAHIVDSGGLIAATARGQLAVDQESPEQDPPPHKVGQGGENPPNPEQPGHGSQIAQESSEVPSSSGPWARKGQDKGAQASLKDRLGQKNPAPAELDKENFNVGTKGVLKAEIPAKPNISANSTNIIENGSSVFTCSIESEGMNILWVFNNQPLSLSDRMNTSEDNQTLTIKGVKREDAGSYQCEVWNPIGANGSDPLNLTVSYGPEHIMFVPNPESGEIEVKFKDPLTLECQVESYPPALYEWQVNGTVNSDFSGNTIVIKSVSWEDSGKYTCLAKNNVTNLTISKDLTVKVVADKSTGGGNGSTLSGGATAGIVIGVLAGVALIGALIYFLFFRDTGRYNETS